MNWGEALDVAMEEEIDDDVMSRPWMETRPVQGRWKGKKEELPLEIFQSLDSQCIYNQPFQTPLNVKYQDDFNDSLEDQLPIFIVEIIPIIQLF